MQALWCRLHLDAVQRHHKKSPWIKVSIMQHASRPQRRQTTKHLGLSPQGICLVNAGILMGCGCPQTMSSTMMTRISWQLQLQPSLKKRSRLPGEGKLTLPLQYHSMSAAWGHKCSCSRSTEAAQICTLMHMPATLLWNCFPMHVKKGCKPVDWG